MNNETDNKAVIYDMKKHFNHNPFVFGVTVPFNGSRLKNPYFITDSSGEVHDAMPNGGGWCMRNGNIEDDDVTHVRLSGPKESKVETMTGGWRVARDIDYFGKNYPIWCGEDHGFLWPDEAGPDKVIVPVRVFAYKSKRDPAGEITLFVAQGRVRYRTEGENYPSIDQLDAYIKHPAFWLDPRTEIMSNNEIAFSVYQLACFNKTLITQEKDANQLIKLFEEVGIDELKYIPSFRHHLKHFIVDKEKYTSNLRLEPLLFNTGNLYLKDNARTNTMSKFFNENRSPEKNKVDSSDWDSLSRFILSPVGSNMDQRV